jgi:hypothetical protein
MSVTRAIAAAIAADKAVRLDMISRIIVYLQLSARWLPGQPPAEAPAGITA